MIVQTILKTKEKTIKIDGYDFKEVFEKLPSVIRGIFFFECVVIYDMPDFESELEELEMNGKIKLNLLTEITTDMGNETKFQLKVVFKII